MHSIRCVKAVESGELDRGLYRVAEASEAEHPDLRRCRSPSAARSHLSDQRALIS